MKKIYRLKNGYSISKWQCYDGYKMQWLWGVYDPTGKLLKSCGSYEQAYEFCKNI